MAADTGDSCEWVYLMEEDIVPKNNNKNQVGPGI